MKRLPAIAWLMAMLSLPASAADAPAVQPLPPPAAAQSSHFEQAAIGDTAGGRYIPKPVLDVLADPHFDPNVAYILWQLSRKPVADWTLAELSFVAQMAPTALEAHISVAKIQLLFQFWGLDPDDIFNVSLAPNWQSQSTAFSNSDAGSVAAISSADCQGDLSQQTVATFKACTAGR